MSKKPTTLPRGYRTCTASLAVADVSAALKFFEHAFDAKIQSYEPDTAPGFAAVKIGNSMLFVTAGWGSHVPSAQGTASAVAHHMYVEDVDTALATALENGAHLISDVTDTYWGERCATVADPFGHIWTLATRVESLKPQEISERLAELLQSPQSAEEAEEPKSRTEAA